MSGGYGSVCGQDLLAGLQPSAGYADLLDRGHRLGPLIRRGRRLAVRRRRQEPAVLGVGVRQYLLATLRYRSSLKPDYSNKGEAGQ